MSITINGTGTITGISAGGLNDSIITQSELATGVAGTGPAFSAYGNKASISSGTDTKLTRNTEEFDTANCYDTSNSRFTPNVAGYYQVNGSTTMSASSGVLTINLYKNGSEVKSGAQIQLDNAYSIATLSVILYMNGTTDYIEIYGYQSSGGTINEFNGGDSIYNYFQSYLVRAA